MERTTPPENTDLPLPWEDKQITKAQWQKHKEYLMRFAVGDRPDGWWLFERNMEPPLPPWRQTKILYEMGELKGAELERVLGWWRAYYDDANELKDRTTYWRWQELPPSLIKKWDRERKRAR
jgi:hypothetical protein